MFEYNRQYYIVAIWFYLFYLKVFLSDGLRYVWHNKVYYKKKLLFSHLKPTFFYFFFRQAKKWIVLEDNFTHCQGRPNWPKKQALFFWYEIYIISIHLVKSRAVTYDSIPAWLEKYLIIMQFHNNMGISLYCRYKVLRILFCCNNELVHHKMRICGAK